MDVPTHTCIHPLRSKEIHTCACRKKCEISEKRYISTRGGHLFTLRSFPYLGCWIWKEDSESNLCKTAVPYLTMKLIKPCFLCRSS